MRSVKAHFPAPDIGMPIIRDSNSSFIAASNIFDEDVLEVTLDPRRINSNHGSLLVDTQLAAVIPAICPQLAFMCQDDRKVLSTAHFENRLLEVQRERNRVELVQVFLQVVSVRVEQILLAIFVSRHHNQALVDHTSFSINSMGGEKSVSLAESNALDVALSLLVKSRISNTLFVVVFVDLCVEVAAPGVEALLLAVFLRRQSKLQRRERTVLVL